MTCNEIKRKLNAFMDRELDDATSRFVERHLDACSACRKYLQEFQSVDAQVQGLPRIELDQGFVRRVVSEAIRDQAGSERFPLTVRLKHAIAGMIEGFSGIFGPVSEPDGRTLDEFNDCPPLSMSFIYFKLLDQPK